MTDKAKPKIRIFGTLLSFYRLTKSHLSVDKLLDKFQLGEIAGVDAWRHWEHGVHRPELVRSNPGLLGELLQLGRSQIELLKGAVAAEDFLDRFLEASPTDQYKEFQAILSVPASEMRHWLRRIFLGNTLEPELKELATVEGNGKNSRTLERIASAKLVDETILDEIRRKLMDSCAVALENGVGPDKMSQLLLFLARSASKLPADSTFRSGVLRVLKASHGDAKQPPALRHICDGLDELGEGKYLCDYIKRTETEKPGADHRPGPDGEANLAFLKRLSNDNGQGIEVLNFLLRALHAHFRMERVGMLAIDFRTTAQLIASSRRDSQPWATPLGNLPDTLALREQAECLFGAGARPPWFQSHRCNSGDTYCQKIAIRYAGKTVEYIDQFGKDICAYFNSGVDADGNETRG